MKKLVTLGFSAILLASLAGCSDASVEISTGDEALITVGSEKITNDDLFRPLFIKNGLSSVSNLVSNAIYDKEVPLTDETTATAQENLAKAKEESGDGFVSNLASYGFKDEEDFYNRSILPSTRMKELSKKYLDENAEAQITQYKPVKVRIIQTTAEENATKALAAVKEGSDFEEMATEYGKTDTYKGNEIIVNNASGLPTDVWSKISVITDKEAMIDEVIKDATNAESPVYYVVKVTNTNALEDFKDDALASILEKSTSLSQDVMVHYLEKYDFHVYDIDIYNLYKSSSPSYLVQDAD